ncbi:MAG TPA: isoprenylcysteine carboxylmethyltransferase family protein [Candidatus Dormibacteraeota bacterium]|nr:isoprenylcysteine carboxylmethyltransferase family protein [Candidatus Dormibacteraeota bacterium]
MDAMQICADFWTALGVVWAVGLMFRKPTQERAGMGQRVVYGIVVIVAFWVMFSGRVPSGWLHKHLYERTQWTDWTGVALTALGVLLAVWARFFLGRNWSGSVTVKVGHELIRTGPYHFVRHPIYTGLLLAMLGTGMVRARVSSAIGFALLFVGFWMKMRIEESFMRKTFGGQHEDYARTTGALVPRFW